MICSLAHRTYLLAMLAMLHISVITYLGTYLLAMLAMLHISVITCLGTPLLAMLAMLHVSALSPWSYVCPAAYLGFTCLGTYSLAMLLPRCILGSFDLLISADG